MPTEQICPFCKFEPTERIVASNEHAFAFLTNRAEGFNLAWNEGKIAGQNVSHFHLHVVPRKIGDAGITEYEPRKFLYRSGSREESPDTELLAVANLIRSSIE